MGLADGGPLAGGRLVGGLAIGFPHRPLRPESVQSPFILSFLSSPTTTIPTLHHYATGLQLLCIYSMPSTSVSCHERSAREAKLELYGLFQALKAVKMYIVGLKNLVVEVDAKYIKGMINNPDSQPNTTINRWIAGILLFDFKLQHVAGKDHAPADGLS